MLPLTPQRRLVVATPPVDCRPGIDGLAAVCRHALGDTPLEGAVYVLRNRASTALTLVLYDGQGDWFCLQRLSQGRLTWWPHSADARVPLSARERIIVLWNGHPERAQMAHEWSAGFCTIASWLSPSLTPMAAPGGLGHLTVALRFWLG